MPLKCNMFDTAVKLTEDNLANTGSSALAGHDGPALCALPEGGDFFLPDGRQWMGRAQFVENVRGRQILPPSERLYEAETMACSISAPLKLSDASARDSRS
jgi:hypothetical protein